MAISDATIQEIKNRIDIIDVIGDFVSLKKVGTNYRALSPFTNEKTPSFYVSPSKEIFKCFSSGKGGDAISFVMEVEGINYIEALKYLAQKYGIEVQEEEMTDEQIEAQNERDSLFIVLGFAGKFFQEQLFENSEGKSIGLSYFKERGFNEAIINKFELGYALDEWDGLLKAAKAKGHSEEMLQKAGLVLKNEKGRVYDRFRSRVVFPIHNVSGKTIAFGARTLRTDKKEPKYINSPETEVYHKSNVLYGIHQAKQAIRNEDMCYLVEGYTDVISLHLAGVENVVASSGTSLTKEQIQLISRYTKNITVLYDGDSAGIKASFRGINMILEHDLDVHAVVFPEGEDPDSFSKTMSFEAFQNYLKEQAQDFITFKTNILTDGGRDKDPGNKVKVIREVIESIALIPDGIKRSVYIKTCAGLLDIQEQVLISELNKLLIQQQRKDRDSAKREEQQAEPLPPVEQETSEGVRLTPYYVERECLRVLINYGNEAFDEEVSIAQFMLAEIDLVPFEHELIDRIMLRIAELVDEGFEIKPDLFLNDRMSSDLISELTVSKHAMSSGWEERHRIYTMHESDNLPDAAFKLIYRFKKKRLELLIEESRGFLQNDKSQEEVEEHLKVYMHLKGILVGIDNELGTVVTGR